MWLSDLMTFEAKLCIFRHNSSEKSTSEHNLYVSGTRAIMSSSHMAVNAHTRLAVCGPRTMTALARQRVAHQRP
jgi:hypothetical protein